MYALNIASYAMISLLISLDVCCGNRVLELQRNHWLTRVMCCYLMVTFIQLYPWNRSPYDKAIRNGYFLKSSNVM